MAKEQAERRRPFQEWIPDEAVEHAQAARKAYRKSIEGLFPREFIAQRRTARKEMLLAIRSVVNRALERVEAEDEGE